LLFLRLRSLEPHDGATKPPRNNQPKEINSNA
jgi:hypothetical protein